MQYQLNFHQSPYRIIGILPTCLLQQVFLITFVSLIVQNFFVSIKLNVNNLPYQQALKV